MRTPDEFNTPAESRKSAPLCQTADKTRIDSLPYILPTTQQSSSLRTDDRPARTLIPKRGTEMKPKSINNTTRDIVKKLCDEALEQNKQAKAAIGINRKNAYERKTHALSTLIL